MPHDVNGKLLNVGDEVIIHARVKEIHQTEEFCNCNVETGQPMYPGNSRTVITLNTKQVEKVERGHVGGEGYAAVPIEPGIVHDPHCCAAHGCHKVCSHLCGTDLATHGCCGGVKPVQMAPKR